MCNLYANRTPQADMRTMFEIAAELDLLGNYRGQSAIWPKHQAPVVRMGAEGGRELVMMRWGFLTPKVSKRTGQPIQPAAWNNARDDKLRATPLWRDSFRNRRCLIPGTAFREAKGRNPATDFWFALKGDEDRPPFAFAGLWRADQPGVDGEAKDWLTHTMVTTEANELVKPVHPTRMPVILEAADYKTWLTGAPDEAAALLRPFPAHRMHVAKSGVGVLSDDGTHAD